MTRPFAKSTRAEAVEMVPTAIDGLGRRASSLPTAKRPDRLRSARPAGSVSPGDIVSLSELEADLVMRHGRFTAQRMLERHERLMGWYDWHMRQADFEKAETMRKRAWAALETPPPGLPVWGWLTLTAVLAVLVIVLQS